MPSPLVYAVPKWTEICARDFKEGSERLCEVIIEGETKIYNFDAFTDEACPVPDLLYISLERLGDITLTDEACPVPPELVIEIISPEQSFSSLSEKAVDYLKAGVAQLVERQLPKL